MIRIDEYPHAGTWISMLLGRGGTLSRTMNRRLAENPMLVGTMPHDWAAQDAQDFDRGGQGVDTKQAFDLVDRITVSHLSSGASACILVEDLAAKTSDPCGGRGLPWIAVTGPKQDEILWVADRRSSPNDPDTILGAAIDRRPTAVLSEWDAAAPGLCSYAAPEVVERVGKRASFLVVPAFDGESYVILQFASSRVVS